MSIFTLKGLFLFVIFFSMPENHLIALENKNLENTSKYLVKGELYHTFIKTKSDSRANQDFIYNIQLQASANCVLKARLNCNFQDGKYGNVNNAQQYSIVFFNSQHRLEIGKTFSIAERFRVNAATLSNFNEANIGINGNSVYWMRREIDALLPEYNSKFLFLNSGVWSSQHGSGLQRLNNFKINYIFNYNKNLKLGLSYSPWMNRVSKEQHPDLQYRNVLNLGAVYNNIYGDLQYKVGAVYEFAMPYQKSQILWRGQHNSSAQDFVYGEEIYNLQSFILSTNLKYRGFTLGYSYSSALPQGIARKYSNHMKCFDFGSSINGQSQQSFELGYAIGPLVLGVSYLEGRGHLVTAASNKSDEPEPQLIAVQSNRVLFSAQYRIKHNLLCYFEIGDYKLGNSELFDHHSTSFFVGLKMKY